MGSENGAVRQGGVRLGKYADDLVRVAGITGADFTGGADALTADDQIIFAPQFVADFVQSIFHAAVIRWIAFEVA